MLCLILMLIAVICSRWHITSSPLVHYCPVPIHNWRYLEGKAKWKNKNSPDDWWVRKSRLIFHRSPATHGDFVLGEYFPWRSDNILWLTVLYNFESREQFLSSDIFVSLLLKSRVAISKKWEKCGGFYIFTTNSWKDEN